MPVDQGPAPASVSPPQPPQPMPQLMYQAPMSQIPMQPALSSNGGWSSSSNNVVSSPNGWAAPASMPGIFKVPP